MLLSIKVFFGSVEGNTVHIGFIFLNTLLVSIPFGHLLVKDCFHMLPLFLVLFLFLSLLLNIEFVVIVVDGSPLIFHVV